KQRLAPFHGRGIGGRANCQEFLHFFLHLCCSWSRLLSVLSVARAGSCLLLGSRAGLRSIRSARRRLRRWSLRLLLLPGKCRKTRAERERAQRAAQVRIIHHPPHLDTSITAKAKNTSASSRGCTAKR